MATIQGDGGGFTTLTGFNIHASGWSIDMAVEVVDNTGFEDGGYRVRDGAIVGFTGSVTGKLEDGSSTPWPTGMVSASAGAANLAVAKGAVTLTAKAGNAITSAVVFSSISINRAVGESADLSYSIESSGYITDAWS